jgi:hypothetical protein
MVVLRHEGVLNSCQTMLEVRNLRGGGTFNLAVFKRMIAQV